MALECEAFRRLAEVSRYDPDPVNVWRRRSHGMREVLSATL
jgi:hypothetical protein